jgi:glycosyltransferase involved in cell wall biosynthesis
MPPTVTGIAAPLEITVIVPAYNAGPYLDAALASVAGQTRPPMEVIVVDDGSTDGTAAIAAGWHGRLGTIRLRIIGQSNRGLSVARNRGLLASRGDLVAFLDADDEYLPEHLALLAAAFEHRADVVMAFGDMRCWPEHQAKTPLQLDPIRDSLRRISTPFGPEGLALLGPGICAANLRRPSIVPSAWVIRRDALPDIGLFLPHCPYGEDLDFFVRLTRAGRIAWCDRPTARRRLRADSLTGEYHSEQLEPEALRLYASLLRRWDLTAAERAALDEVADRSVFEVSYDASGRGPRAFLRWRRTMRWLLGRRLPSAARLLARSVLRPGRTAAPSQRTPPGPFSERAPNPHEAGGAATPE